MRMLLDIFISMRPRQWTKNTVIFAALIFSQRLFELHFFLTSLAGFGLFCLVSGSIYLFNDVVDAKYDRTHPEKKSRPVAAGRLSKPFVLMFSMPSLAIGVLLSFAVNYEFGLVISGYAVLQILYTIVLKKVVLVDVFIIALGFVIRAAAGAYILRVYLSPWLLVCTLFLSLFLALSKRRHELMLVRNGMNSRQVLSFYSLDMLDQMINIVASGTVITYALYTMAPRTVSPVTGFGTHKLIFTVPFVLFGIFRYLYLVHKKMEGGSPERVLLTDVPLMVDILLYGLTASGLFLGK